MKNLISKRSNFLINLIKSDQLPIPNFGHFGPGPQTWAKTRYLRSQIEDPDHFLSGKIRTRTNPWPKIFQKPVNFLKSRISGRPQSVKNHSNPSFSCLNGMEFRISRSSGFPEMSVRRPPDESDVKIDLKTGLRFFSRKTRQ